MDIDSLLSRRVTETIDKSHLTAALKSKKKLRVKLGIDPTGADLHLGHAVTLWKLREFQDAGHKAVFIIGDWTAQIGDPSGKDKTRQGLTEKQVAANAKHFFDQAHLILDKAKTEIHLQSEWFKKFGLKEVVRLASQVSVQQLMAHETFAERIEHDQPFFAHEILYPLLQGYDSVAVKADVELGAMEQKFNLLMGRRIQKAFGLPEQDVILLKYLIGLDGKEKMSKTLSNYISLRDSATEMFGKVMSIPDELIIHYFELCTEVPEQEYLAMADDLKNKVLNPRMAKVTLGKEIVKIYHGKDAAQKAADVFEAKFGKNKGEISADFELKKAAGSYPILDILVEGKLAVSKSEARRKIAEGAVEIDDSKIKDFEAKVSLTKGSLIRLGKRFLRII
ncbi:MAG: tyrosine--tRNA ligase [Candidatus Doudnabacteria bacterium RIFCSPHIGHO2_02_FULL_48_21]|uniref:Tyrosine--tRNA ligase n=1 Tax=Candidatus Doudnabacteria bacterium RIFCSPLOWO2_02_FULL_48_13 TaxID=1817845 RepID=A0A1F5QD76_9BACT|nr:MAG: tyrosine--tRNA ligase [Candidatus Doudnabacteria bacterium RIFCSPHIGHO2_01_48_18]OGE79689.1 MAG: tyrosine--tRNA ligase [Candidatus Doudnabacteria bacterium RIFCSPHIGHO2_01_FULL_48_180]OGE91490.1 MAG: tyrosine--tRNA ligase [Candidatus Doudnabacteria bacterium RIFCSPHIGHO2_12_FULL_47_25]OGE93104.1 MAG: tyrosine--tRNA ligase [Candidatus Doudnabacteria bacterium RIFCSPHIGHO2_02_FULL_48_21]OGE98111.1 MAG: tyrosine--tRNA ligase [Candidatus Doudnabacteria bacterium RIFCSPLOWO2_01_FULL_48_57]O